MIAAHHHSGPSPEDQPGRLWPAGARCSSHRRRGERRAASPSSAALQKDQQADPPGMAGHAAPGMPNVPQIAGYDGAAGEHHGIAFRRILPPDAGQPPQQRAAGGPRPAARRRSHIKPKRWHQPFRADRHPQPAHGPLINGRNCQGGKDGCRCWLRSEAGSSRRPYRSSNPTGVVGAALRRFWSHARLGLLFITGSAPGQPEAGMPWHVLAIACKRR